jgi:GNAT superfamily N-acetyltransferase
MYEGKSLANEMMEDKLDVNARYIPRHEMTEEFRQAKHQLQVECFSDVAEEIICEYFVAESSGSVLAWIGNDLVGCVSVFVRNIEFENETITLGGYGGTCTREDQRGRGIGSLVCRIAMDQLRKHQVDIAMLAVGADGTTAVFYERQGFRFLGRPFEIVTASGKRVAPEGDLAMIAPVKSNVILSRVMASKEPLFLGPEPGYW